MIKTAAANSARFLELDSETKELQGFSLGRHLTIEYYDCDPEILYDSVSLSEVFIAAAEHGGARVIDSCFRHFQPQGVSGFVIIAESHFSVHTWPEHNYAAVDFFTCGDSVDLDKSMSFLRGKLGASDAVVSADMARGVVENDGLRRILQLGSEREERGYTLAWRELFKRHGARSLQTSIDLYECSSDIIQNPDRIKNFVREIRGFLELTGSGKCEITAINDDDGGEKLYHLLHLTGNVTISGRFHLLSRSAYIDIDLSHFFEPRETAEFALTYFEGVRYKMHVALRQ